MTREPYYRTDLAWVHHAGFAGHVESTWRGIVTRLREHGLRAGQRVLDVGCGSGCNKCHIYALLEIKRGFKEYPFANEIFIDVVNPWTINYRKNGFTLYCQ